MTPVLLAFFLIPTPFLQKEVSSSLGQKEQDAALRLVNQCRRQYIGSLEEKAPWFYETHEIDEGPRIDPETRAIQERYVRNLFKKYRAEVSNPAFVETALKETPENAEGKRDENFAYFFKTPYGFKQVVRDPQGHLLNFYEYHDDLKAAISDAPKFEPKTSVQITAWDADRGRPDPSSHLNPEITKILDAITLGIHGGWKYDSLQFDPGEHQLLLRQEQKDGISRNSRGFQGLIWPPDVPLHWLLVHLERGSLEISLHWEGVGFDLGVREWDPEGGLLYDWAYLGVGRKMPFETSRIRYYLPGTRRLIFRFEDDFRIISPKEAQEKGKTPSLLGKPVLDMRIRGGPHFEYVMGEKLPSVEELLAGRRKQKAAKEASSDH